MPVFINHQYCPSAFNINRKKDEGKKKREHEREHNTFFSFLNYCSTIIVPVENFSYLSSSRKAQKRKRGKDDQDEVL